MKKAIAFVALLGVLFLSACSSGAGQAVPPQSAVDDIISDMDAGDAGDTRILVVYFTMPDTSGVDAVAMASRVVENGQVMGNTAFVAELIGAHTGGDLFAIETVQEYAADEMGALLEQADAEQAENARPELAAQVEDMEAYDVVFIGFPNWWADMPMPLYTFFEAYDFTGKTVVPFSTHGGSGFSGTIGTITEMLPGATVVQDGFTVAREQVPDSGADVIAWLDGLEL